MPRERRVAQVQELAEADRARRAPPVADEHRHLHRQVPCQAGRRAEHLVAGPGIRVDVDDHAPRRGAVRAYREHLARAAPEQLERALERGALAELDDRQSAQVLGFRQRVRVPRRLDAQPLAKLAEQRRTREPLGVRAGQRVKADAADRRRQGVQDLEPEPDALSGGQREGFDLARRARGLQRQASGHGRQRARERLVGRNLESQSLDRADELDRRHHGGSRGGRRQELRMRCQHDVLGTHDEGDLVTVGRRVTVMLDREAPQAQPHALALMPADEDVGAAEKARGEARRRSTVQRARLADLLQAAPVHQTDAVGHAERLLLIVRDEDRRDADGALDPPDRPAQLVADTRVECAERLVEQQHPGLVRERPGDGDALLLSARELGRIAPVVPLERDELQQLAPASASLFDADAARAQCELDVVGDAHVPEQRVVLEHEADLALARAHLRHVATVQHDAPAVDVRQPRDGAQQRALAAA